MHPSHTNTDLPPAGEKPPTSNRWKNRISTTGWIRQAFKADDHHAEIIKRFQDVYLSKSSSLLSNKERPEEEMNNSRNQDKTFTPTDGARLRISNSISDEEPVNILVLDGGAMKGMAQLGVLEVMLEDYGNEKEVFDRFALFAGTSIGGMNALMCGRQGSLSKTLEILQERSETLIAKWLPNINFRQFLKSGSATAGSSRIISIMKSKFGSTEMLYNPQATPSLAVCSMRIDGEIGESGRARPSSYKPLVLRNYKYPDEENTERSISQGANDSVSMSTCSSTLYEALSATSAVPGLANRVNLIIDGVERHVCDGILMCNCPVAIAMDEARKLYPHRPLGVVISLGFDTTEDHHIMEAVEVAKEVHPGMHFHRIVPPIELTKNIKTLDKDLAKIAAMKENVKQYMRYDKEMRKKFDETMKKLGLLHKDTPSQRNLVVEKTDESDSSANHSFCCWKMHSM